MTLGHGKQLREIGRQSRNLAVDIGKEHLAAPAREVIDTNRAGPPTAA
jgi:hypothetical protein